jgi:two-component system CheB/CheR fusion protein
MTDSSSKRTEVAARQDGGGRSQKLPIVGIGVSAGGLEAIRTFFGRMPIDTGMAFVMIPHLDPGHKSLMAEIIGRCTEMPTAQVEDRIKIEPNHIYVVQPNRNLEIEDGELVSCEISRTRGINLPVDFFFRSLAEAQRERAIGIILSGTMRDGAMGLKDIKEHGGLVIAQSPETAQHDGMPRSAIDTGMVDLVLPVEGMTRSSISSPTPTSTARSGPRTRTGTS